MADGHTKIRNGLYEHLAKGWMDGDMYAAYSIMLHQCDWNTGVWRGSAGKLVVAMGRQWSEPTARRVLRRLEQGRYISRELTAIHGNYDIEINNYEPPCGPDKGKRLRRTKTAFWRSVQSSVSVTSERPQITDECPPVMDERPSQSPLSGIQESLPQDSFQDSFPTDQPTNQPTNQAPDGAFSGDEFETPSGLESEPNQNPTDLELFFPRAPLTPENIRMFDEMVAALDKEDIPLDRLLSYNWEHIADGGRKSGLRLRSLAQTHKAIVHGDPENGVHSIGRCNTI